MHCVLAQRGKNHRCVSATHPSFTSDANVPNLKLHHLAGSVAEIPLGKNQRASVCEHISNEIDIRRRDKRFKTKDDGIPFEHTDVPSNGPKNETGDMHIETH